jgi:hypothetical protein
MDGSSPTPKPRLREQFQAVMRLHHYSIRTKSLIGTGFAISSAFISYAIRWSWAPQRLTPFSAGWR